MFTNFSKVSFTQWSTHFSMNFDRYIHLCKSVSRYKTLSVLQKVSSYLSTGNVYPKFPVPIIFLITLVLLLKISKKKKELHAYKSFRSGSTQHNAYELYLHISNLFFFITSSILYNDQTIAGFSPLLQMNSWAVPSFLLLWIRLQ